MKYMFDGNMRQLDNIYLEDTFIETEPDDLGGGMGPELVLDGGVPW